MDEIEKTENDESEELGPTSKRWDPLGADNVDNADDQERMVVTHDGDIGYLCSSAAALDTNRIKSLEEEQEILTSSLMALTSHFAQVQFRLRQIVEAPACERDQLLRNLEEFAFRGIPEVAGNLEQSESEEVMPNLERAHQQQFELIERLKRQLTELENFAYESGAPVLPQSILLEKQKILIDELKSKLNLNVNDTDLPQLSSEDLKSQVETAIGEFVGPLKMKEQLVTQLKTQITDLERFIAFLQSDTEESKLESVQESDEKQSEVYNTYVMKKRRAVSNSSKRLKESPIHRPSGESTDSGDGRGVKPSKNSGITQSLNGKAHSLLDKASTLLQMFAVAQFGCGSNRSTENNTLKRTCKLNHWGDIRAQLEVDIQEVISLVLTVKRDQEKFNDAKRRDNHKPPASELYYDYSNDSDDGISMYSGRMTGTGSTGGAFCLASESFSLTSVELTSVVRRNFAVTLQKLIQHGLRNVLDTPTSLVPFMGCLNPSGFQEDFDSDIRGRGEENANSGVVPGYRQMHAWELILEYYNIKNGDQYNETPARKLSQSFNLDIVSGNAISSKQNLLSAIGSIVAMHSPYKRSYNSHFKAFVCAGLNSHKLVQWLNLIFQCTELVHTYYTSWSYVARTGFRDALRSIDRLTRYDFDLPVDLAIRQFQNIKDVFM